MQFVHLHLHSYYSILDGEGKIENYFKKAAADHQPAMALTDHGNMFGIKEFLKTAKKFKGVVKPIVGCEVYVNPEGRFVKRGKEDQGAYHLILLAKNLAGYYNLVRIVSIGWTEGFYYKPKVDREILEKYHENLIASSACLGGELPRLIAAGNMEEAEKSALWFKKVFGEDYYFEIQQHRTEVPGQSQEVFEKQKIVNAGLFKLSEKLGIKCIATNDCHFVNKEDGPAHDRLICINTNARVTDADRMHYTQQEYMKTAEEMAAMHITHPEIITNTLEVAAKVEEYDIDHDHILPIFKLPDGYSDSNDYLRDLVYKGAETRYPNMLPKLKERIDFELQTIKRMGFPDYFLIVQDFINAARARGIWVGPGRGSAAGSVVAYCLGITKIDPIKYDLLFERFLNPDRISLPDIDTDFDDDGRGKVLDWVTDKYGADKVAHIITYGTMATKLAIKDVARVEKLPLNISNDLCKKIHDKLPDGLKMNLPHALKCIPALRAAEASNNKLLSETIRYAKMLEGNVRNTGIHACGTIICRDPISDWVPVSTAEDKADPGRKLLCTQYEGSVIEETGLIKMDFLGLKTLSILKEAVENIRQSRGVEIDLDTIPIDDPETYQLYCEGRTIGTFQFESAGMQKYLRELHPSTFEDLIAMNALYRPGPMDYIPDFIDRKLGRKPVIYDIPCMEKYLKDTYGITVYQEQVMLLSRQLAGFTRGESDTLRKAMGKKLKEKLDHLHPKFIEGGQKNGHKKEVLEKIWADWEKFASYAFNKSHATCYSWVAYQTAYLKAHYPAEYMAAVMSRNLDNITEITKLMDECKAMGIETLGPDVNESRQKFSVNTHGAIRFGLAAVKGIGGSAASAIIEERDKNGVYKDVFDVVQRVSLSACNRKCFESMALSGGFDSFDIKREQYFADNNKGDTFMDTLMRYGQLYQSEKSQAQNSLFGESNSVEIATPPIPNAESWSDIEKLNKERELVGIYLSAHPLDEYNYILENMCNTHCSELGEDKEELAKREEIKIGGIVTGVRPRFTKTGKPFGVVTLEDFEGTGELALFGDDWTMWQGKLQEGYTICITAKCQQRYKDSTFYDLKISNIEFLQDIKDKNVGSITIMMDVSKLDDTMVSDLSTMIADNPGSTELFFQIRDVANNSNIKLKSRTKNINVARELLSYIKENPALDYTIN